MEEKCVVCRNVITISELAKIPVDTVEKLKVGVCKEHIEKVIEHLNDMAKNWEGK